jgi:hypothetical protein
VPHTKVEYIIVGVLPVIYLCNCGGHRVALGHQILVMRRLEVSMIDGH